VNNFDRARQTEHDAVFGMCMRESFVLSVRVIEVVKSKGQIRCEPNTAGDNVRIEAVLHERTVKISLSYHKRRQTFKVLAGALPEIPKGLGPGVSRN
jgi:hypothetical protein